MILWSALLKYSSVMERIERRMIDDPNLSREDEEARNTLFCGSLEKFRTVVIQQGVKKFMSPFEIRI